MKAQNNKNQQSEIVLPFQEKIYQVKNYLIQGETNIRRSTIATIDLEKMRYNVQKAKQKIQTLNPDAQLMAIVKANCYGHGSVGIARDMILAGVNWFGVALMDEGIELRNAGITDTPILLLGLWEPQCVDLFFQYNITPVIGSLSAIYILNEKAKQLNTTIKAHIKIDTGMGRVGLTINEFKQLLDKQIIEQYFSNIIIEGLMTHCSSADQASEMEFTINQNKSFGILYNQFTEFLKTNKLNGNKKVLAHFSNSSSTMLTQDLEFKGDIYRVGDVLYGGRRGEYDDIHWEWDFKPILEWSSVIASVKSFGQGSSIGYNRAYITQKEETLIAVIPVGYADGYPSQLSNIGKMIVINDDGEEFECPIRGKVCMDLTMIEVTDVPKVREGNKVLLVGKQLTQEVLARWAGTNPSAITCCMALRIPRIYINSNVDKQQWQIQSEQQQQQ